jgi:thiamine biosynthesis lipoprotein
MGTLAEVAVVHGDPRYAHGAIDAAVEALRAVERSMTRFTAVSDVGRVNRLGTRDWVVVSAATGTVLAHALEWAAASDGAFDPCLGAATELWEVGMRTSPPPHEAVRRLAGGGCYRGLDLDAAGHRARLTEPEVAIDLGGIAKGYGVDRAVAALREWGVGRAIVNVGGDLYAMGRSDDGDPWRVGIRDPRNPTALLDRIEVTDAAVATSGDYLQYFDHDGRRYHHLLDPATAAPRESAVHSVTVAADACITADAAATTVFGMERSHARRLLGRQAPDARIVSAV